MIFKFVPRAELTLTEPLSDERSVEVAESYSRVDSTRPLLRVSDEEERPASDPDTLVESGFLLSSGLLAGSTPPGWNVLDAGIVCCCNGLPTG